MSNDVNCISFCRFVIIRRQKLLQEHVGKLNTTPRANKVDQESLRWTPLVAPSTVASEEEMEAEKEVFSVKKD